MKPFVLFVLLAFASTQTFAVTKQSFTFLVKGKVLKVLSYEDLTKRDKPEFLEINEIHENKQIKFSGIGFRPLLDSIYGQVWRTMDEVLFTCEDGYQPSIPVSEFLEDEAYIAFERLDQKEFSVKYLQQKGKTVPLGSYYLVWKTKPNETKDRSRYPRLLTKIDLISFREKFKKMAPQDSASAQVREGFLLFRSHCMPCHTINGEGGSTSGIELNTPMNITEYFKEETLKKWILNPESVRDNARMPPLDPGLKENRPTLVDRILEYLKHMKHHKNP